MITVALLVQPPVLHGLLAELLASDPGVRVVGGPDPDAAPDVVMLSQPDPDNEATALSMLLRFPHARVLALAADARRAVLYELRPHRTPVAELSRGTLLAAVHGIATEGR